MKVLHLLSSNRFSGAENVVCQIIDMFSGDADIEMTYCSPDGQIRETLKEKNISFEPITDISVKEVKRIINNVKPDVIHAHDMRASFVAAHACGKIPLVSHVHNNNFNSRGLSIKSLAYLFAGFKAKHIFWVSQSSFDGYAFHKELKKKSSVLYNVINVDELYKKMNSDEKAYNYDVVYLGRLTYQKNPERLIEVIKLVVDKRQNTKVAIVGTGELEESTKKIVNNYGLQDNVEFLGFQSNPLKLLHDSKVMLLTSRWEGTPMCALEAMALGVPIVSTPTDGMNDLIQSGINGFLNDSDDGLSENVLNILDNDELRENISKAQIEKSAVINNCCNYKSELEKLYLTLFKGEFY